MADNENRIGGGGYVGAALILFDVLLFAGAGAAALAWRPAAAVMVAGLAGVIGVHLLVGVAGYRTVMQRPWPKVPPLQDDDD